MRLTELIRFPIKSCRGTSVPRARVGREGLEHDRRWMLVDSAGTFVTQREEHRLALVDVAIEGDTLRVSASAQGEVRVPLSREDGEGARVTVWRSEVDAVLDADGSAWFSSFLARDIRLAYMPERSLRPVSPRRGLPGDVVSFADGFPLLLASAASLDDLGARIERGGGTRVPMARFRPNVVVDGAPPWDEDAWQVLTLGAVAFRAPKPCDRCVMTTIDPATAMAEREPLRTLATFRRWALPGEPVGVWFGLNLIPDGPGELVVGDPVEVRARADSPSSPPSL